MVESVSAQESPSPGNASIHAVSEVDPGPALAFDPGRGWRSSWKSAKAIADCLLPDIQGVEHVPERVSRQIILSMQQMPPLLGTGFRVGALLMEVLPLLTFRSWRFLRWIPREKRREVYKSWRHGRYYLMRQLAAAFQAPTFFAFYDLPDVRSRVGYQIETFLVERLESRKEMLQADEATGSTAPQTPSMVLD